MNADVIRKMYWLEVPIDTALDILLSRGVNISKQQIEQLYRIYDNEDNCTCHYCTGHIGKRE